MSFWCIVVCVVFGLLVRVIVIVGMMLKLSSDLLVCFWFLFIVGMIMLWM